MLLANTANVLKSKCKSFSVLRCLFGIAVVLSAVAVQGQADTTKSEMPSLEDLLRVKVVSPSNFEEELGFAPATVVVITRKEMQERGYNELSELYDDLPGMDIIRTYGDTYFMNYFRGFRYTIGSPYLVMVDGVMTNNLYFGTTTEIVAMPVSNVEQVEVVYGPASSVYGANASMGVVNIITRKDLESDGTSVRMKHSASNVEDVFSDFNMFYKRGDFRLSVSGHVENGNLRNRVQTNDHFWQRDKWYADTLLWGDLTNNTNLLPAQFSSPIRNYGFDVRAFLGKTELVYNYSLLNNGYGLIYPGDRIPASSFWPRNRNNAYVRHIEKLSDKIISRSLVRWRSEGVRNDALDMEGYNRTNNSNVDQEIGGLLLAPNETARMIHITYWESQNYSWSLFQDLEIKPSEKIQFITGFKYELKNLQRAYNTNTTVHSPLTLDATDEDAFPTPLTGASVVQNHIYWRDQGVYLQTKYFLNKENLLNFGVRFDDNNVYGSQWTFRGGYVARIDRVTFKLLYGESFQEPVPRSLYGGWTGSGSDPFLEPEESRTIEANLGHASPALSNMVSLYYVLNDNTVINYSGGARNGGSNKVLGLDYHVRCRIPFIPLKRLELWGYYSIILDEEEDKFDAAGDYLGKGSIGDLAYHKAYFGVTAESYSNLTATLRGRYIGPRVTVETNPLGEIAGYYTLDLNVQYRDFLVKGLGLSIKTTNVLNAKYYHPGIRDADANDPNVNPELIDDIGWNGREWNGSQGWYNSRLPQPQRVVLLSLTFDY